MSKRVANLLSVGAAIIVALITLIILSKVEIGVELGVAILIAFGVWGIVRGVLYTATGTHIVVGWWRKILWHLIPLACAGAVLVFVGGVSLDGKSGWDLVEAGLDAVPGVSSTKAEELRKSAATSLDRLVLSPVKGLWSTATAPVAKEYAELKKLLASLGAKGTPEEEAKKVVEGNVVVYLGGPHPADPSKFSPLKGFVLGLRVDGVDAKIPSVEKMTNDGWASVFSGSDLKIDEEYEIFVSSWSSDIPEKQRKEVKQKFVWKGESLTFPIRVK